MIQFTHTTKCIIGGVFYEKKLFYAMLAFSILCFSQLCGCSKGISAAEQQEKAIKAYNSFYAFGENIDGVHTCYVENGKMMAVLFCEEGSEEAKNIKEEFKIRFYLYSDVIEFEYYNFSQSEALRAAYIDRLLSEGIELRQERGDDGELHYTTELKKYSQFSKAVSIANEFLLKEHRLFFPYYNFSFPY